MPDPLLLRQLLPLDHHIHQRRQVAEMILDLRLLSLRFPHRHRRAIAVVAPQLAQS
jgi:hypothetical protein